MTKYLFEAHQLVSLQEISNFEGQGKSGREVSTLTCQISVQQILLILQKTSTA